MITAPSLAIAVAAILILLALIHAYWAMGGRVGAAAAVPTGATGAPAFAPGRAATLAVAAALLLAAGLVLGRAEVMPRFAPDAAYHWGTWTLGALLAVRAVGDFRYVGLFKRVRRTRFGLLDTRLYTPLCIVLGGAVLYLAGS